MVTFQQRVSPIAKRFFSSEKSSGVVLFVCTVISLCIANSPFGDGYLHFWHTRIGMLSIEQWVNDGLMAIFFLSIGLELEREFYSGKLAHLQTALLPIIAAAGGIVVPAVIHFSLNAGTPTHAGMGIPMATDIAFALGALALVGHRVPASLKLFLTALAVMDDLGAIVVIAVFYTAKLATVYLFFAMAVLGLLVVMNRVVRIMALWPYLLGGAILWYLMLKSGVHATIAGVLLAFALPYSSLRDDEKSPSCKLEHRLHVPVAFIILPIFALANTGIVFGADWGRLLLTSNSVGIIGGLVIGKPVGITLLAFVAVSLGLCRLPDDLRWKHIFGAGLLGGIGFTMSIFITNLAFQGDAALINVSKIAILLASLSAGMVGFLWLKWVGREQTHG